MRFREIRNDAGLSARALAAATGQHFTRVSKIEHGVQAPSDQDIRDWCRACGAEEQVPELIATARAVQSAYLEFRRQARSGMYLTTSMLPSPLAWNDSESFTKLVKALLSSWRNRRCGPGSVPPRCRLGNSAACLRRCRYRPSPSGSSR